jgi:signal transduction histidine kinase
MKETQANTITRKLTRMNMLVSGAALVMACAAFVGYDVIAFRQTIGENLSVQARIAGLNSVSALVFDDPHAAQETLSALKTAPHIVAAGIYSTDGKLFAAYRRDAGAELPPSVSLEKAESRIFKRGDSVAVTNLIAFQGKIIGLVYIRSDLKAMTARLQRFAQIAAAVLLVSLWAAWMWSSVFRRSIAGPIMHLAELARFVSREQDYGVRATPAPDRGEISTLIDSFNEMLGQIQGRDEELRKAHDELEVRVKERTAQLEAANKELESFSYSVSHDLRAPLRSINGFSEALLEDCFEILDETGRDHLNRIRAATKRMGIMIDDFLNLARMSRAELHFSKVNVSSLARLITGELQNADPRRNAEIRIEDGLETRADGQLLRLVLENLLGNAWKFTSKRPLSRIEFGTIRSNGTSAYFVRDNGAGFDPAYSSKLFGTFQRLHDNAEFPGTGVGLATVQRIIKRHGGRVWAESEVEKGATFFFTLN